MITKSYLLGALSLVAILSGCERAAVKTSGPTQEIADVVEITKVAMLNMQFSPVTVEVAKGGTIQWTNHDMVPHTATSAEFGDSGMVTAGASWQHTFKQAGEFPYGCTLHPTMKGTVIVK